MDQDQKTKGQTTHDAADDPRNRDIKIYVNGEIVHRDEAKVSVYDFGLHAGRRDVGRDAPL